MQHTTINESFFRKTNDICSVDGVVVDAFYVSYLSSVRRLNATFSLTLTLAVSHCLVDFCAALWLASSRLWMESFAVYSPEKSQFDGNVWAKFLALSFAIDGLCVRGWCARVCLVVTIDVVDFKSPGQKFTLLCSRTKTNEISWNFRNFISFFIDSTLSFRKFTHIARTRDTNEITILNVRKNSLQFHARITQPDGATTAESLRKINGTFDCFDSAQFLANDSFFLLFLQRCYNFISY